MKSRTKVLGIAAVVLAGAGLVGYAANQGQTRAQSEAGCQNGCPFAAAAGMLTAAPEMEEKCCGDDPSQCCGKECSGKSHVHAASVVVDESPIAHAGECGKEDGQHGKHKADCGSCGDGHDHDHGDDGEGEDEDDGEKETTTV